MIAYLEAINVDLLNIEEKGILSLLDDDKGKMLPRSGIN